MTIQWFPGHMLETENLLKKAISKVDAVLEILDARLPQASANPFVNKICKDKFRLKVLNKNDLADPEQTKLWLEYFETQKNTPAISINGTQKSQAIEILNYCVNKIDRNRARKLKVMVLGIPNTGKSTILNSLAGKKIAKTGDVPAITRHQQRTSLKNNIDVYDTPGILWPVIEPQKRAYILAASGAISDTAIDYSDVAFFAANLLIKRYPELLMLRYPFFKTLPTDELTLIEKIGSARGCLKKGGRVDLQKASEALIRELRAGKIGKISFETPKDIEHDNEN
ncbi:MAG: ribosome biogenesis GTPase YlqF [Proteobacteria bacterium]|nr:ribosome biogenesis GTPase YlqF [Pseudomonadota bacterium]MBU1584159.1 ribosome biogenesis GTPase YlqF [Pseudomonadota bacterium]MBU2454814.1 ribosome biogenesis GTPase YlqF [Pseudomonadota bacterium]MBU2629382.1 ribosome biogenesis GTPase YlqF [Pseudomonadota bacterium]